MVVVVIAMSMGAPLRRNSGIIHVIALLAGWTNGRTDERTDGRTDGWTERGSFGRSLAMSDVIRAISLSAANFPRRLLSERVPPLALL